MHEAHEAKPHLSRLLNEVSLGTEVVIAKAGKPVARLVPIESGRPTRKPGLPRGKIRIAEGFDASQPQVMQETFEGSGQ